MRRFLSSFCTIVSVTALMGHGQVPIVKNTWSVDPMTVGPIQTDCGPVIGKSDPLLGSAFLKIPYAVPPTPAHDMRFRRSKLLSEGTDTCWEGTFNASVNFDGTGHCIQNDAGSIEDCLTLNIWSPALSPTRGTGPPPDPTVPGLPVFFFIHGGLNPYPSLLYP